MGVVESSSTPGRRRGRAYDGGVDRGGEELDDQSRLDLANVVASAALEGQEISREGRALAVEYLAGRLDGEMYRRRVREMALGARQLAAES